MLSPYLPETLCTGKLLEVLGGDGLKLLDQAQHPDYFLYLLPTELIEKLLDRTVTSFGPIEVDFTHLGRLTQT